ncbi:MAG: phage holin family protein [Clostridia bacterium]|nr:phage holin family protein [Clostridia bacterium]
MEWNKIWDKLICYGAAAAGGIAGAFGGWDTLLSVLMAMMAADYLSGFVVAAMGRSLKTVYGGLSSKVGAMGLAKKGLMLLCVLVAALLDRAMGADHAVCRDAVCWFYIANEGLSLLENLSLAGVPFPKRLKELLGQRMETDGGLYGSADLMEEHFVLPEDEEADWADEDNPFIREDCAMPVDWDGAGQMDTEQPAAVAENE